MESIRFTRLARVCGGELAVLKLEELLKSLTAGNIQEYEYNRGTDGPMQKRVNEIAKQFRPESLGTVTICRRGSKFELVDGHTRCRALIEAEKLDIISSGDRDKYVSILIVEQGEFLTRYKDLNNNEPHKPKHYITNVDLPLGKLVASILKDEDADILKKFSQQLAQMVVVMNESHDADWNDCIDNYIALAQASSRIKEINKFEVGYITKLSPIHKEWLEDGMRMIRELRGELASLSALSTNTEKKKLTRKLLQNTGFFGGCLIGSISDVRRERFIFGEETDMKEVARKVFHRVSSLFDKYGKMNIARHGGEGALELKRITKVLNRP